MVLAAKAASFLAHGDVVLRRGSSVQFLQQDLCNTSFIVEGNLSVEGGAAILINVASPVALCGKPIVTVKGSSQALHGALFVLRGTIGRSSGLRLPLHLSRDVFQNLTVDTSQVTWDSSCLLCSAPVVSFDFADPQLTLAQVPSAISSRVHSLLGASMESMIMLGILCMLRILFTRCMQFWQTQDSLSTESCAVCYERPTNPVTLMCGHQFCGLVRTINASCTCVSPLSISVLSVGLLSSFHAHFVAPGLLVEFHHKDLSDTCID